MDLCTDAPTDLCVQLDLVGITWLGGFMFHMQTLCINTHFDSVSEKETFGSKVVGSRAIVLFSCILRSVWFPVIIERAVEHRS